MSQYLWDKKSIRVLVLDNKIGEDKARSKIKDALIQKNEIYRLTILEYLIVHLDVTYFKGFGLLLAINNYSQILYYHFIYGHETSDDYLAAIYSLKARHMMPEMVVIDLMPGLKCKLETLGLKVQYCQFHQIKNTRKYLTNNPRFLPNIELKKVALSLTRATKKEFQIVLDKWIEEYGGWLRERDLATNQFLHKRTRSAYFSLRRNLDNLFTHQEMNQRYGTKYPNTNNRIEGYFSNLKRLVNSHNGLNLDSRFTIICKLLRGRPD